MSMSPDDISLLNIDYADGVDDADVAEDANDSAHGAVDGDGAFDADDADTDLGDEGSVDWICQFCPSFLCINCA